MPTPASRPRITVALLAIGVVAAAGATWAGLVLTDVYRPHATIPDPALLPAGARRSDTWTDWHLRATVVMLLTAIGTLGSLAWLARAEGRAAVRPSVLLGSAMAVAAAGATLLTRRMVAWDQIALSSVTVGSNTWGYGSAGFDDGVRFVLVDGVKVTQNRYAAVLLVHLTAPAIGGVSLLCAGSALWRGRPRDVSKAPEAAAHPGLAEA